MLCCVRCFRFDLALILAFALFLAPVSGEAGSLRIGPVPGLTTVWHVAPDTMSIPVRSTLTFKRHVPAGATLVWSGATEVATAGDWSFAECFLDDVGSYTVSVKTVLANGAELEESAVIEVVAITPDQISVSPIQAEVDAVALDSSDLNASTQEYFFGPSIAELREISSVRYRTSTRRPVRLSVEVEPAGFASLMEWRIAGRPPRLGSSRQVMHQVPTRQWIAVGPTENPRAVFLETYRVEITSHVSDQDVIPQGVPVTFTAATEPPGYEEEITWLASTKYGTSDPVMGKGPQFTVRFDDTWGPHPLFDEPFQWLGVKADGTVYNQDQKPPPSKTLETGCGACGGCKSGNCGGQDSAGQSVYLFSGEYYESAVDLRIRGRGPDFVWARKYRSCLGPDTAQGNGWDSSYNIRLERSGAKLVLFDGNTRKDTYSQSGGVWTAAEFYRELSQNPDGSYTLTFPDTSTWNLNPLDGSPDQGKIGSIVDRNGNTIRFQYDAEGRLATITDTLDRDIQVAYNADGFIESVTDFAGRQVRYEYYQDGDAEGSFGDLKSVRSPTVVGTPNGNDFPEGKTTRYTYTTGFGDENLNHNLLTITDPKGQTYLTNVYSDTTDPTDVDYDTARRQIWGDPDDVIDFVYLPQTPSPENGWATSKAIVNDRVGNVKEYFYDGNRSVLEREYTGRADPDQPTTETGNRPIGQLRTDDPPFFATRWEYNADARVTRVVDPNGNVETMTYDDGNASRRSHGNVLQSCRVAGPLGGEPAMICESYEYDDEFGGCCGTNFVTRHVDGRGNETLHEYDAAGNRLHTQHRIPSIVEDFEYNAFGQMTAHILPDNGSDHRRRDEFTYYDSGPQRGYRESEIVDAPGFALTTSNEYDLVGNVIRVTDPEGHDTQVVVNELDQTVRTLSAEVDLAGGPVRYERDTFYDANDNVVRMDIQNIDDQGALLPNTHFTTLFEHDVLNYQTASCNEVGDYTGPIPGPPELPTCEGLPDEDFLRMEYEYDGNRNRALMRNGEAVEGRQPTNVVRTLYDERDLLFRDIRAEGDPDQSTTQYDYDLNRNLVRLVQGIEDIANRRITDNAYDGYDRLVAVTDPMGNRVDFDYDANHNHVYELITGELIDDNAGADEIRLSETAYVYDDMDRLIRREIQFFDTETQAAIDDASSVTTTEWSDSSHILGIVNDNGHETRFAYDTANRRQTITDAKGNTTTLEYDDDSLLVEVMEVEKSDLGADDQEFSSVTRYDALHRAIATVDNAGNSNQFSYDSRDNRVVVIDALDHEHRYRFDGIDRLVASVYDLDDDGADGDGADITTAESWDDSSRLVEQQDDNDNTTTYEYDSLDRKIEERYADSTKQSYVYDVHDNRIQTVDANGSVVTNTYDLNDRITGKSIAVGPGVFTGTDTETYAYDGMSRLVHAADNDSTVARSFDSLSNVTSETLNGQTTTRRYDGVGNKLVIGYPGGRIIVTTYGELERKNTIADAGGTLAEYFYVGPQRVERREFGNGTRTDYTYDGITGISNPANDFGVKQVIATRHERIADGSVIDSRSYTWDRLYNKTQRKDLRGGGPQLAHDYAYDDFYRLVQTTATDPLGIPLREQRYELDGAGNRNLVMGGPNPGAYTLDDAFPDPADKQVNQYTETPSDARVYDDNGNLVRIDDGLSTERVVTYDYRNQMVEYLDTESGQRHSYSYDAFGRRIARIVDADGAAVETRYFYDAWQVCEEQDGSATTRTTYVYGRYIDEVLTSERDGTHFYFHADDLYNVMALTDGGGNVVERYDYGDYGLPVDPGTLAPLAGDPSAVGNPYGFTGRRYDPETGWYYYRNRYQAPDAGRFTTRDPIGMWGDAGNLGNGYTLVGNNPLTWTDPYGEERKLTISEVKPLELKKCGYAKWVIQWKITERAGAKGGHVVQHVVAKFRVWDCAKKKNDITVKKLEEKLGKKGNKDGSKTFDFREAWPFNKDKKVSKWAEKGDLEDDTYLLPDFGKCTQGNIVITGRARYHEGGLPKSFKANNPATLAAILPSTTEDPSKDKPKLAAGTAVVKHDLSVKWNCCPDTKRKTELVHQDPKPKAKTGGGTK